MNGQHKTARQVMGDGALSEGTRERLLDVSIELFYRHGVHAVGLDVILAEVGTTKTTFYKYFESKDDLVYAALQRRDAWELEWFHNAIDSVHQSEPALTLLAVFDVLHEWFTDPRFQGFAFINSAAQFPGSCSPVHHLARKHMAALQRLLEDTAKAAAAASPNELSQQLLMIVEGTFSVRHVMGDNSAACIGRELARMAVQHAFTQR